MNASRTAGERVHAVGRRRFAVACAVAVALVVATLAVIVAGSRSIDRAATHGYPYAVGAPIDAVKLTRLEMLSARVGVGVAPIVTDSGRLLRAYLVRTTDAGATWTVTGVLPEGFYPWTTAFTTPREGYVIGGGALFTRDAGRTWSRVATSSSALAISVSGNDVWISVERYCPSAARAESCGTYLDAYRVGDLVPASVERVPTDQPVLAQVAATSGYAIASGTKAGVWFTADSGASWRRVVEPCSRDQVDAGSVASSSHLFTYCQPASPGEPASATLFQTGDAGTTWRMVARASGVVLDAAVGSTGRYGWAFSGATLVESRDAGRVWTDVPSVRYGTSGAIATYGAHDAWHVVCGHGIYRTLDGRTWRLLT